LKWEEEREREKGKRAFDINKDYDLSCYSGRFMFHVSRVNPLLFFTSESQIEQAKEVMLKYKLRQEAASRINTHVYLTP
jgi:hypothetical protein